MSVNNGEQKVLTQLRESNGHYYTLKAAEEVSISVMKYSNLALFQYPPQWRGGVSVLVLTPVLDKGQGLAPCCWQLGQ